MVAEEVWRGLTGGRSVHLTDWPSVEEFPHDHALVAVNLYAGNQYWFSAAGTEPVKKIAVTVYDESGKQVITENYDEGAKAAAGFSPANSGQYFISVDLVEGEEGTFCLVYSYK